MLEQWPLTFAQNLTNIAPYFIRTTGASNTRAAIYLAPVFVGFTTGSVTSGYIIRK